MKIEKLKNKGWEVLESTDKYYTIRRPKRFNWTSFIVLSLILNVFGFFGYIIYYNCKSDWQTKLVKK